MKKGVSANGIHTYTDFDLFINKRKITPGSKKEILANVPHMNGVHDFSAMSGEVKYSNATLQYYFDIAELTTEEMEAKKNEVEDWFYNVVNERIDDDYSPDYYYIGSASKMEWNEDFGQGEAVLNFSVYPYKYKKEKTTSAYAYGTHTLKNTSSHSVKCSIIASRAMQFYINGNAYEATESGEMDTSGILLQRGDNEIKVLDTIGNIEVSYTEERFC